MEYIVGGRGGRRYTKLWRSEGWARRRVGYMNMKGWWNIKVKSYDNGETIEDMMR